MLRELKYEPITEIMTPQKAKLRDQLCYEGNLCYEFMHQNNVIPYPITHREKNWACHQYTFSQILGYGIAPTNIKGDYKTLYKYFKQVKNPQENAIGLYINEVRQILHSGIVLKNGRMRSKWGSKPYSFDHDRFTAPDVYESRIVYFMLQSEYDNAQGKEEVACQMYYDLTLPGSRYSKSTHDGAEKPKTYPQFIESKFPNVKIVHSMPKENIQVFLPKTAFRNPDKKQQKKDLALYRELRDRK